MHKLPYIFLLFSFGSVCVFAHQCIAIVIYGPGGMGKHV